MTDHQNTNESNTWFRKVLTFLLISSGTVIVLIGLLLAGLWVNYHFFTEEGTFLLKPCYDSKGKQAITKFQQFTGISIDSYQTALIHGKVVKGKYSIGKIVLNQPAGELKKNLKQHFDEVSTCKTFLDDTRKRMFETIRDDCLGDRINWWKPNKLKKRSCIRTTKHLSKDQRLPSETLWMLVDENHTHLYFMRVISG